MSDLKAKIKQIMVEYLDIPADSFDDQTSFSQELRLDSLDAMDLILAIDEALKLRIPVEKMEQIDNLQQLTQAVSDLQK